MRPSDDNDLLPCDELTAEAPVAIHAGTFMEEVRRKWGLSHPYEEFACDRYGKGRQILFNVDADVHRALFRWAEALDTTMVGLVRAVIIDAINTYTGTDLVDNTRKWERSKVGDRWKTPLA